MNEFKGDEQEFYFPELESMNINNTFKKKLIDLQTDAKKASSDHLNNVFPPSTKGVWKSRAYLIQPSRTTCCASPS